MMIIKYTLDMLNQSSVSVKTEKFVEVEGEWQQVGQPHRKAYINSVNGRQEITEKLPQVQKNAIFAVWGDTPIVDESIAQ